MSGSLNLLWTYPHAYTQSRSTVVTTNRRMVRANRAIIPLRFFSNIALPCAATSLVATNAKVYKYKSSGLSAYGDVSWGANENCWDSNWMSISGSKSTSKNNGKNNNAVAVSVFFSVPIVMEDLDVHLQVCFGVSFWQPA